MCVCLCEVEAPPSVPAVTANLHLKGQKKTNKFNMLQNISVEN